MVNVTGWTQLVNGSIVQAVNVLYISYYGDWFITLLFIGFKIMLYFASNGNPYIMFVSTLIILSMFLTLISKTVLLSIVAVGILELGFTLYDLTYRK